MRDVRRWTSKVQQEGIRIGIRIESGWGHGWDGAEKTPQEVTCK